MNCATVCTGIGAPEVAWQELGWKFQWFAEIEKFASRVLAHHYPNIPNIGDMTKLKGNPIYEQSIIDLLIGGTPCQSFSVAGLRGGLDDERGNLALEYCRILIDKRPTWFVWENVPGVLSSFSDEENSATRMERSERPGDIDECMEVVQSADFATLLEAFQECGYSVAYRILDAQYFGVPQRRRRIFVVGHIGNDWRPPAAVLFEPESLRGDSPPSGKEGAEITGTLTPGAHPGSYNGQDAYTGHLVAGALSARGVGTCGADDNQAQVNHLIMAHGQGNAEVVRDGSPLKSSESGTNVRRLTPLECERLQGFPDNYTAIPGAADGPRYKAIGNSMAVPVMRWLGRRIDQVDKILKKNNL